MNFRKIFITSLLIVFGSVSVSFAEASKKDDNPKKQYSNKYYYKQFQEVFERVQRDYVQDADMQGMTDEAIDGMLKSLDPYSGYYTDEDLDFFISQTDGEFGGIGVEIVPENGAVKIITPIDDLPAYKAGIRAGDYIIGVNGELVSNMGFNKAVQEMRGEPGTDLNLLVLKEDKDTPEEIELTRQIVTIDPVKYEIEYEEEIGVVGYIRITAFNNKTTTELKKAVADIEQKAAEKKSSLKGIILDLRNNPGGLLDQSSLVSEYFLDHGVIVTAKGKKKDNEIVHTASRFVEKAPDVPIVVLINSGTASAAEIVAGALQDHKRAIILGTTSFGKGLVQTFTQINERAAVKITTQKYFTPSGRSINAKGIEPDIYIELAKVEFKEKEEKEKKFTSSSIKSYLKKYNKDSEEDDGESKKSDQDTAKDTEEKKKEGKRKLKEKSKKANKPEREMSEKYREDYQYARAYDLIMGLIISGTHKTQDCPVNAN